MESKSRAINKGLLFTAIACMATGGFSAFIGFDNLANAVASTSWPRTPGVIVESRVVQQRRIKATAAGTYRAEIAYVFELGGADHVGNTVAYGQFSSSDAARATRLTRQYPEGMSVEVSYSPANPAENVLEPGFKWQVLLMPAAGLVFLAAGFYLLKSFRQRRYKVA